MEYFNKLQIMVADIETRKPYNGYFYKVANIITIIVIGLLCNLKSAHEIY